MIQRKQSIWLFLAAMLNGALFIFPVFRYQPAMKFEPVLEFARSYLPLFIVAAVITLLPLITIFLFGNRKRQKGMTLLNILLNLGFMALALMRVSQVKQANGADTAIIYDIGMLLPVAAIVFLFMAWRGIRHDEKLIKSLDRLR